jgi:hypothetical protein
MQVGKPFASLDAFIVHGFSDDFLAARIRFLAAYERVYSTDHPLTEKQRKISVPQSLLSQFEALQKSHHEGQDWIMQNPDADGGRESKHNSFAIALLNRDTWTKWVRVRKHNWWIPLASPAPDLRYAHDMMVSHGITLFSTVQKYGINAIEVNNTTQHIKHTNNLCIAHIDKDGKSKEAELVPRLSERQLQMEYVQENMAICEQVAKDLVTARLSATTDRVTRGARRVSTEMAGTW